MFETIADFTTAQLANMGVCGVIIGGLTIVIYKIWGAYQSERKRCEKLADKLYNLSRDTMTMLERITGR